MIHFVCVFVSDCGTSVGSAAAIAAAAIARIVSTSSSSSSSLWKFYYFHLKSNKCEFFFCPVFCCLFCKPQTVESVSVRLFFFGPMQTPPNYTHNVYYTYRVLISNFDAVLCTRLLWIMARIVRFMLSIFVRYYCRSDDHQRHKHLSLKLELAERFTNTMRHHHRIRCRRRCRRRHHKHRRQKHIPNNNRFAPSHCNLAVQRSTHGATDLIESLSKSSWVNAKLRALSSLTRFQASQAICFVFFFWPTFACFSTQEITIFDLFMIFFFFSLLYSFIRCRIMMTFD